MKREKLLYQKLVNIIDIAIIETSEIWTKGIFFTERGLTPKIYIKKGLEPLEKLKVLLHEYIHYIHLTKFFEKENRAESEFIAESSVIFILYEFGIESFEELKLTDYKLDERKIKHLSSKIQQICNEIISKLK